MNCSSCGKKCYAVVERSFETDNTGNDVNLVLDDTVTPGALTATLALDPNCTNNKLKNNGDGWCVECNFTVEIADSDLVVAGSPTPADVVASALVPAGSEGIVYYVGAGTATEPDFAYHVGCDGTAIQIQTPAGTPTLNAGCGLTLSGSNLDLKLVEDANITAFGGLNVGRTEAVGVGSKNSPIYPLYSYENNTCGPVLFMYTGRTESRLRTSTTAYFRHYVQITAVTSFAGSRFQYQGEQSRVTNQLEAWHREYGNFGFTFIVPVGGTIDFQAIQVADVFSGNLDTGINAAISVWQNYYNVIQLGN